MKEFQMKDLEEAKVYLGIKISKRVGKSQVKKNRRTFMENILICFKMKNLQRN